MFIRCHLCKIMFMYNLERRLAGWGGGVLKGSSWFRIGAGGGSCKYGHEPAGSGATDLVIILTYFHQDHLKMYSFHSLVIW
jgi:hypothetical protein